MPLENILYGTLTLKSRWESAIRKHATLGRRWIEPTVLPDKMLIEAITSLSPNQLLKHNDLIIAANTDQKGVYSKNKNPDAAFLKDLESVPYNQSFEVIQSLQYIIENNKRQIIRDWQEFSEVKNWDCPSPWKNTFCAPGVELPNVFIDDKQGPVIIHREVVVLPGAKIMGPIVLLPGTVVKMGAELYPGSTFGTQTTINGEIKNCIFHEYTSKGHAGYVGDSVLGRWNNFGAGTTVSNVANSFSKVTVQEWCGGNKIEYDSLKRGVVTGDFVKLGIQSKVYRGTSIGSFSSIATTEAITGNIPELSWWTNKIRKSYQSDKLREHCSRQMNLQQQNWSDEWEQNLAHLNSKNMKGSGQ